MSNGRKISDHSSWMGGHGKDAVMPDGAKTKSEKQDGHDGHTMDYGDTSEKIAAQQMTAVKHSKSHKMKSGFRY